MNYPVHIRAVKKWMTESLQVSGDEKHFIFEYEGSTCRDGGTVFNAKFHVFMKDRVTIERVWIEIPPEELEPAEKMCSRAWVGWSGYENVNLEKTLMKDVPVNYAGCLCSEAMINHKWKMVLSTVHYYFMNAGDIDACTKK